eukprot:gene3233-4077_t
MKAARSIEAASGASLLTTVDLVVPHLNLPELNVTISLRHLDLSQYLKSHNTTPHPVSRFDYVREMDAFQQWRRRQCTEPLCDPKSTLALMLGPKTENVCQNQSRCLSQVHAIFYNLKGHASVVMNGEADIDTFREEAGAVMISDCSFSHNHGYYGVIYTMGDVIIRDSIMTANTAEYGGVLHVRYVMAENSEDDDGPSISISGSNVEGNAAVEGGGVLYCGCNSVDCTRGSPEISVSGSNLKNNLAKDLLRSSEITTGTDGGVVRVSQMAARISINDSNMENNTAHGEGGVVYSDAKNLVLYITESQMADNSADANGGVAAVDRDSGVFITASVMFRNRAQVSGGVIYSPSRLYGFDGFSYIVHSAMTLNSALQ